MVVALVLLTSVTIGAVGVGLRYEDYCSTRAGERASNGPRVRFLPPRVQCRFETVGGASTTDDAGGELLVLELAWAALTAGAIGLVAAALGRRPG